MKIARRLYSLTRLLLAAYLCSSALPWTTEAAPPPTLDFYTRPGCPRCAEASSHLEQLVREHPELIVVRHDVVREPQALARLRELSAREHLPTAGVPAFVFQERLLVGFEGTQTPERLRALLAGQTLASDQASTCAAEPTGCEQAVSPAMDEVELPLLGRVSVERLGLPLFTIAIGLLDGFNPCATWVLLFLLAMLVNLNSRPRMLLIAATFVAVSGIVYFAFMAAWLTFFTVLGVSQLVRVVLASIALGVGIINIKDFVALGHGPSLSIPEKAKPGLYARVRAIIRAESLPGALAGIVVLAFMVNLVELLCTAGLPALYTAILTSHGLPTWQYYSYLGLYIAAYVLDDSIMVTIGVVTLSKSKLQERGGRWLKLLSGLVITGIGILLLVRPHWLGF